MIDAAEVERRTGWRVVALPVVASTNDEVAARRDAGDASRLIVVADRQLAGRGRGGHRFESPLGGLYASLLLTVRAVDLPAPTIAAVAVALAEAIEALVPVSVAVKWPNDLWIGRRKVAGILTEASIGASPSPTLTSVIVGVGVNVTRVPSELAADVAAATTALDLEGDSDAGQRVTRREDLVSEFLRRLDARVAALGRPESRDDVETAYRARLAMRGEAVRFQAGDAVLSGVLLDASLDRGLLVRDGAGDERWWAAALVREVRPAGR